MNNRRIICIVGPTASGKTELGVYLAKKFSAKDGPAFGWNGAEIISADSRQVYRQLDIGTGKEGIQLSRLKVKSEKPCLPAGRLKVGIRGRNENAKLKTVKQNARYIDKIPQYLIDICEPEEEFSLFDWLEMAREVIEDVIERGKLPIIVGGTGLYVQALVEGFAFDSSEKLKAMPTGRQVKSEKYNSKIKKYTREELDKKTLKELQEIFSKLQTPNARLDINNSRRLIRAIERAREGTSITKKKPDFEALQIGITLPRPVLYEKIDKRVNEWFQDKIIEEVRELLDTGVDPNWLKKIGLNYRLITQYLESKDENITKLKEEIKFKIHAYARRQMTWFGRFEKIKWINDFKEAKMLVDKFLQK